MDTNLKVTFLCLSCHLNKQDLGANETSEEKHSHKISTGLSRDFGVIFLCVFSHTRNNPKKHINKSLAPTHSRENPPNLFVFMCFFSFPEPGRGLVADVCGDPLLRYTVSRSMSSCRSRFPVFFPGWSSESDVVPHVPVAPVARQLPGVSHVKLPLKRVSRRKVVWQLHLLMSRYTVQLR